MIELKCYTEKSVLLTQMTMFQGESKKRTDKDIDDLAMSLASDGLLQPFSLWQKTENELMILDGHGRLQALVRLALKDPSILTQEFPVNMVIAETEEEARKACLQMMSTYGKINKTGVIKFAGPIVGYSAPVITKAMDKPIKATIQNDDLVIVKLRVQKDKVPEFIGLLKQVTGVEVL